MSDDLDRYGRYIGPLPATVPEAVDPPLWCREPRDEWERMVKACQRDPYGFKIEGRAAELAEQVGISLADVRRGVMLAAFRDLLRPPLAD